MPDTTSSEKDDYTPTGDDLDPSPEKEFHTLPEDTLSQAALVSKVLEDKKNAQSLSAKIVFCEQGFNPTVQWPKVVPMPNLK
eukprot:10675718-Karenia_brevis.AAC.1